MVNDDFWRQANSSFLDSAVLGWCCLFADREGRQHWRTVVGNNSKFENDLLKHLKMSKGSFRKYAKGVLRYRNKFVAHLDEDLVAYIPRMKIARLSASFLYDYLIKDPIAKKSISYDDMLSGEYYVGLYRHGKNEYRMKARSLFPVRQK